MNGVQFKFVFVFFFVVFVTSLYGQSPWHVSVSANLSTFNFNVLEGRNVHSIAAYDHQSEADQTLLESRSFFEDEGAYTNLFAGFGARLGVSYQWRPWLQAALNLTYNPKWTISRGSATGASGAGSIERGKTSFIEVAPSAQFDLSWKQPNESFFINLRPMIGRIDYQETIEIRRNQNGQLVNEQELDMTRVFNYFRFDFGIEWRDYFSKHWGYFLYADISVPMEMEVSKIKVDRYRLNFGEVRDLEGQKLDPADFPFPPARFEGFFLSGGLGITYRL